MRKVSVVRRLSRENNLASCRPAGVGVEEAAETGGADDSWGETVFCGLGSLSQAVGAGRELSAIFQDCTNRGSRN